MRTIEFEQAVALANRVLDRPSGDPDDDLALLAREFLRATEHAAVAALAAAGFAVVPVDAIEPLIAAAEADLAGPITSDEPDDEPVALASNGPTQMTFGHIRRARAALLAAAAFKP